MAAIRATVTSRSTTGVAYSRRPSCFNSSAVRPTLPSASRKFVGTSAATPTSSAAGVFIGFVCFAIPCRRCGLRAAKRLILYVGALRRNANAMRKDLIARLWHGVFNREMLRWWIVGVSFIAVNMAFLYLFVELAGLPVALATVLA